MLAKKKAAKKVAMKAAVDVSRAPASAATSGSAVGKRRRPQSGEARPVLTRRDVLEAGSGDGRTDLIKKIGDNVNTRLQEISFDDDIDADLFDERKRELLEEARLAAGTQQRVVSDSIAQYVDASSTTTAASAGRPGLELLRIRHNSNAVTAVAHLGSPPEVVVFGDKAGKVYLADLAPRMTAQGLVHSVGADARRHQKLLLEPVMNAAVVSMAISDTRGARPTTRDLFEKTTVDVSCTSYIVAGAADGAISVWETATRKHKGLLSMHKKPITGLSFRALTSTLFSVCQDGTLRVWSVPQMMAVDKLFGHEGPVYGVDALRRESCASVGQDGTMRFWNIPAATQQAYAYLNTFHPQAREATSSSSVVVGSGKPASSAAAPEKPYQIALECVAMLSEQLVVAGAVDGSLIIFDVNRRKPLQVVPAAHGYNYHGDGTGLESAALLMQAMEKQDEEASVTTHSGARAPRRGVPNPITAVAAVPYSDVIASASYDGIVRLWRVSAADSFIARGVHADAAKKSAQQQQQQQQKHTGSSSSASASASGGGGGAAASSSPSVVQLLAELPVHAIVTSLHLSSTGDALVVACSKEPRLGRWVVQRAALNSVCVFPLTSAGLKSYKHLVGLSIEHVPALLYGFKDDEEEEEEEANSDEEAEDEAKAQNVAASGMTVKPYTPRHARGESGSDDEDDDDEVLDALTLDDEDQDTVATSSSASPFFVVGADGQLQFRPSALPSADVMKTGDALPKKKKSNNKKGGKEPAATPAATSKKAKKASGVAPKKAGKALKGKDSAVLKGKKKLSKK